MTKRNGTAEKLLHAAHTRMGMDGEETSISRGWEAEAREKLPAALVVRGAGGELVPQTEMRSRSRRRSNLRDTLAKPDAVAAEASHERLELLNEADALAVGVDLADSVKASNSVERALMHQLGATHVAQLRMTAQMNRLLESMAKLEPYGWRNLPTEACRLAGAVSRLSLAYQSGVSTLQRVRAGGAQTIVVQHTYVGDGGQAVVAGQAKGRRGGSKRAGQKREG